MVRKTSKEAYSWIKKTGFLGKRQAMIYEILFFNGPLTANQVYDFTEKNRNIQLANVHARLTELKGYGVVKELGTINCPITKRKVLLWDVTSNLPVKNKQSTEEKIRKISEKIKKLVIKKNALKKKLGINENQQCLFCGSYEV